MLQAAFWGAFAGSSILLGAILGMFKQLSKLTTGLIMSFGTGVLIGAASFELLIESVSKGGLLPTTIGFLSGSIIFTVSELIISHRGGHERKRSNKRKGKSSGLAILIGTIIDAIPESVIIGVSLLEHGTVSYLMVIAVFISNFPEGLSSTIGLKRDGYQNKTLLMMWSIIVLLASISSLLGYLFLNNASPNVTAFISSFAAGGIIAMIITTMVPEAFEDGGPIVGFISSLGLVCSLILSHI
ncbi:ZIP family metal transporter [Metabacillus niabensis]|uniref:ZIP family zinc transporter n=2 Tax=Metabacillus niabensis TaxID=324854 RepID=A0ABT9YZL9_9BACI|nr:hypothetical protein [Metabacillus niabensis]MDQ0225448.1 ZIP family zinc transporter [Metabacillus niabensis]PAD71017.1 hypothetical protein CHH83_00830 [Bacillus sp. 7586-K]